MMLTALGHRAACAALQKQHSELEAATRALRAQAHDAEQRCTVLQQLAMHRDASMADMQQQLKVQHTRSALYRWHGVLSSQAARRDVKDLQAQLQEAHRTSQAGKSQADTATCRANQAQEVPLPCCCQQLFHSTS